MDVIQLCDSNHVTRNTIGCLVNLNLGAEQTIVTLVFLAKEKML